MQNSHGIMRQRAALVEHPFGHVKADSLLGSFLMRRFEKPQGEFSLRVLEHNFMCVLNILDMDTLRDYCVQRSENKTVNLGYA